MGQLRACDVYSGTKWGVKMCHHLSLLHGPGLWGGTRKTDGYTWTESAGSSNFYCVTLSLYKFTSVEMNILSDSWLDTNLRQFSKGHVSKMSRIHWKVEREKLLKLTPTISPWKMRNMPIEMSCPQSKSISASAAGKTRR